METNIIAVIQLQGAMNGKLLVAEAQKLYDAGTRNLVLDMSELTFISSAGLSALHHIALMYRGKPHPHSRKTGKLSMPCGRNVKVVSNSRNMSNYSTRAKQFKMCST